MVPHFELCAQQVGPHLRPLGRRLRRFRKVGERLACPPLPQQRYPERIAGREKLAVPRQGGAQLANALFSPPGLQTGDP